MSVEKCVFVATVCSARVCVSVCEKSKRYTLVGTGKVWKWNIWAHLSRNNDGGAAARLRNDNNVDIIYKLSSHFHCVFEWRTIIRARHM